MVVGLLQTDLLDDSGELLTAVLLGSMTIFLFRRFFKRTAELKEPDTQ